MASEMARQWVGSDEVWDEILSLHRSHCVVTSGGGNPDQINVLAAVKVDPTVARPVWVNFPVKVGAARTIVVGLDVVMTVLILFFANSLTRRY